MGRLKVYGGKNLPEAKAVANPFQQFMTTDEMYTSRDDLRQSPLSTAPATEQLALPDIENITPWVSFFVTRSSFGVKRVSQ